MINVFTDFHHAGLLNSLIMLFEKRMGGNVYRPIGMEWAEKGYWKVYDHPATQAQFLGIGAATPDNTPPLNEVVGVLSPTLDGVRQCYLCKDIEGDTTNKAITFDEFMRSKFDIVIASIPQHVEPFKKLCEIHPNKPKLIFQIGNAWTNEAAQAPNVMASAIINDIPSSTHYISYHQEFDLKTFYPKYPFGDFDGELAMPEKNIYSFVNVFNGQSHFRSDYMQFLDVEASMAGWRFKSYGGQCRDGSCDGTRAVANKMRAARFIWHVKNGGDGYGHVIHNAAAVGRPLIVKKSYYQGKLAERLLIDGETCIDIDGMSNQQIIDKIVFYSDPQKYRQMCINVYTNFQKVCNFDEEFLQLTKFLKNLV